MDKYILIERFFENTLTEDEKNQFELLLANDTEFARAVAFEKQVQSAIHLNNRATIKSKLQQFEAEQKVVKMGGTKMVYDCCRFFGNCCKYCLDFISKT